jgi:hypothetical protein
MTLIRIHRCANYRMFLENQLESTQAGILYRNNKKIARFFLTYIHILH